MNDKTKEISESIFKYLATDISDRRGLGDEWSQIDSTTMKSIKKLWIADISRIINKYLET